MKKKMNELVISAMFFTVLLFACNNEGKPVETIVPEDVMPVSTAMPDFDPAMDPVKVEAAFIKLLADTLGVKLYEGVYKPGDYVDFHTHPDNIVYVLEGAEVELKMKDGTTNMVEFKKGMGVVGGPVTHSGKIVGNNTLRLVVADIYRPRK
jgi:beta-alanine degradation protein BauB